MFDSRQRAMRVEVFKDTLARIEAEDDLLLVESWESPAHQQAHVETELFQKLQALKARFCDSVEIARFPC